MARELLINAGVGETRIALMQDGRLHDFILERSFGAPHGRMGDIILGRVLRVVPGMQAAFVEIGQARPGFLAVRDAMILAPQTARRPGADVTISDCVREGESVLVQIVKDARDEKGAGLSADLSLAGRLLVMQPLACGLSVSRRIADVAARAALLKLGQQVQAALPGAGYILRTEAVGATVEALLEDAGALANAWDDIHRAAKMARPPATLHHELNAITRTLRDLAGEAVQRIAIDDAAAAEDARAWCRHAMPAMERRIERAAAPVFDDALEEDIAALFQPRVALSSGGWILIEPTEALTAIDVNSGPVHQSSGLAETALTANLEAAREIGRQLRLRGIGGLIVIDFVQLQRDDHGVAVVQALRDSLAESGAPARISPMSDFGIVAVARKRSREPLDRLTAHRCAACDGSGFQPTAQTRALALLRRAEREARANPGRELIVRAAAPVIDWLSAHEEDVRAGLMRRGAGRVRFETVMGMKESSDVVCG
jgi:ribonuclease G